jgi:hypothetical protein
MAPGAMQALKGATNEERRAVRTSVNRHGSPGHQPASGPGIASAADRPSYGRVPTAPMVPEVDVPRIVRVEGERMDSRVSRPRASLKRAYLSRGSSIRLGNRRRCL